MIDRLSTVYTKRVGTFFNDEGQAIIHERYTDRVQLAARERTPVLAQVTDFLSKELKTEVKATFSRKAGCPCGCSPGFCLSIVERVDILKDIFQRYVFSGDRDKLTGASYRGVDILGRIKELKDDKKDATSR